MIQHMNLVRRETAVGDSKRIRRGLLAAIGALESALARATHTRQKQWRDDVIDAVNQLRETLRQHAVELHGDGGLMAEIVLETPRLRARVERLRRQHDRLIYELDAVKMELSTEQRAQMTPNIREIRQRVERLVARLRDFQFMETDLIYEAVQVDIGVGD
ncbi:MAG: hypothetical protein HKN47_25820 [Pirellulaceae bacterium]|nr:hypothetical protein [Pirellulaceae bacterium]